MRFDLPQPSLPEQITTLRPTPFRAWGRQFVAELAPQDWLVVGYNTLLLLTALTTSGPLYGLNLTRVGASFSILLFGLVLVRGRLIKEGWLSALIHRLVVYGSVQVSYFILRDLLPQVNTVVVDEKLFRLDEQLFGIEPTIWADQFITPRTTEWFAFFYFSYFIVLGAYVLPLLFASRRMQLLSEFAFGVIGVFCVGQLCYFLVPGYGPIKHLASYYQNELPHGFWYTLVVNAVNSGGAQMDIFPSLHTAGPSFIAMFAFRHRDKMPFKYTWPITAFFALNIIGATIFLRWHYLVDVLAGLTLATTFALISPKVMVAERQRRARVGARMPIWRTLHGAPINEPAPSTKP